MTALAVPELSMPIVRGRVTVDADSDTHPVLCKQFEIRPAEEDAVRLQAKVHPRDRFEHLPNTAQVRPEAGMAHEQRFPTVEDHVDCFQAVVAGVFEDSYSDLPDEILGHCLRLPFPALVSHRVHVAVCAGKVASAVDLQQELTEWRRPPAAGHDRFDL
jgi:hypothetical protein